MQLKKVAIGCCNAQIKQHMHINAHYYHCITNVLQSFKRYVVDSSSMPTIQNIQKLCSSPNKHTYTNAHTYVCSHMHARVCTHTYTYIYSYMHTHTNTHAHAPAVHAHTKCTQSRVPYSGKVWWGKFGKIAEFGEITSHSPIKTRQTHAVQ